MCRHGASASPNHSYLSQQMLIRTCAPTASWAGSNEQGFPVTNLNLRGPWGRLCVNDRRCESRSKYRHGKRSLQGSEASLSVDAAFKDEYDDFGQHHKIAKSPGLRHGGEWAIFLPDFFQPSLWNVPAVGPDAFVMASRMDFSKIPSRPSPTCTPRQAAGGCDVQ